MEPHEVPVRPRWQTLARYERRDEFLRSGRYICIDSGLRWPFTKSPQVDAWQTSSVPIPDFTSRGRVIPNGTSSNG